MSTNSIGTAWHHPEHAPTPTIPCWQRLLSVASELVRSPLPRHMEIIYEINHHFQTMSARYPVTRPDRRLSLIAEGPEKYVRMAHLACVGSHAINGVAALHTELPAQGSVDFMSCGLKNSIIRLTGYPTPLALAEQPKLAQLITHKSATTD